MPKRKTPQEVWAEMTPEERERYPFDHTLAVADMGISSRLDWDRYRRARNARVKRARESNRLTPETVWSEMTPEERENYPFDYSKPVTQMDEDSKVYWDKFRKVRNKRAQGPKKHKPVSEITEEQRLRRNEVAKKSREKQKSLGKIIKRETSGPSKKEIESQKKNLAEHQEKYDLMSEEDKKEFKIPRDKRPWGSKWFEHMNDEERKEYDRYQQKLRNIQSNERYWNMDPEKKEEVLRNQSDRGLYNRQGESQDEREKRLEYQREASNRHNQKLREENPEHLRAIWKRSNDKRQQQKEKSDVTKDREYLASLPEEEREEVKRKRKNEYMKVYNSDPERKKRKQEKDKERYERIKKNPALYEKEKERKKLDEQRKRDEIKSDPTAHNEYLEKERLRREKRKENTSDEKKKEINTVRRRKYREKNKCETCDFMTTVNGECLGCKKQKEKIKRQEQEIKEFLEENEFYFERHNRTGVCPSDVASRADFVFNAQDSNYLIILEVDENYHRNYTPECETARLQYLRDQYLGKPIFFVRYHPERRESKTGRGGKILKPSKQKMLESLKTIVALPPPGLNDLPCGYNMVFIGYPDERVKLLASTRERMNHEAMDRILNQKLEEKRVADVKRRVEKFRNKKK